VQRFCFSLVLAALLPWVANAAADPTGEWQVAKGYARIRIENCNNSFWGLVAWEQRPGGVDDKNPDATKRGRPTLGMPVLLDMKPTDQNKWAGEIYNSEDGKTYSSHISLAGPDVLQVRGCVLGILCGGEDWTRVKDEQSQPGTPGAAPSAAGSAPRPPAAASKPQGPTPLPQKSGAMAASRGPTGGAPATPVDVETASIEDFCSMVLNSTGAPH
jgi:uncharacterized protein (DUF2147 family)